MAVIREDSVTIEIKSSESLIRDAMHNDSYISPRACIFRTPTTLKSQNEKAYIPRAFSFGPYHHSNPNLKATEKIKGKYLQELMSRFSSEVKLREIINSIKGLEKKARECYAEPINCNPDEFVKILVMDGCFIIELLRKFNCKELQKDDDPVITMACISSFLSHDLVLLENQVPWMVLDLLFNLTNGSHDKKPLIELVLEYFGPKFLSSRPPTYHSKKDIKHILDLLRKWLVSSIGEEEDVDTKSSGGEEKRTFMPSAKHLTEAGIKFKDGDTSKSILDIKFADGVLEIPPLLIHDTTETFFRNLISFEQCYPGCEPRFTSYAVLLDNLINTTKDLEILCDNDIICNWMDPEAATLLFNQPGHTAIGGFRYKKLCLQVHDHCRRHWHQWSAVLVRKYFNTPWSVLSTSAAVILLIMTFLQTLALFVKAF